MVGFGTLQPIINNDLDFQALRSMVWPKKAGARSRAAVFATVITSIMGGFCSFDKRADDAARRHVYRFQAELVERANTVRSSRW